MIVGIGIDAVEVARIRRALERHPGFRERVFTKAELEAATRRGVGEVAYLAKRWAAKEATSKALGVGFSGFSYTEIEVTNLPSGAPTIKLTGELADWAHLLGALRWHLTLSDTRETRRTPACSSRARTTTRAARPARRPGSAAAWTASAAPVRGRSGWVVTRPGGGTS
jgi:holo-[acyl-carrier protein] synthase